MKFLNFLKYNLNEFARFATYLTFRLKHPDMYKNPERLIPENTSYCYHVLADSGGNGLRVKYCAFHKSTTFFPRYAGTEDLCMLDGGDCLGDACKTCGIGHSDYIK